MQKRRLRHLNNRLRDLEAELMKEICTDVRKEPSLLPITNRNNVSGNTTDQGRPDVSGVGVWSPVEKTFVDVRIFHPNAPTYVSKDLPQVYTTHEREKKRDYKNRLSLVENACFSSIVMCQHLVVWVTKQRDSITDWLSSLQIKEMNPILT